MLGIIGAAHAHLGEDHLPLVKIAQKHCYMPHREVVAAFRSAVFPVMRTSAQLGKRAAVIQHGELDVMLDDNTAPRWALLWSHGIFSLKPTSGWTVAHIWDRRTPDARGPESYTNLANLCLMPEFFGSLSDKNGPLVPYLKFHAWKAYEWTPDGVAPPEPQFYELIVKDWQYLDKPKDPREAFRSCLTRSRDKRAQLLRQMMKLS